MHITLKRARMIGAALILSTSLSGCGLVHFTRAQSQIVAPGEAPTNYGVPVRSNRTPMEAALACFSGHLGSGLRNAPVIGVGEIKDYTGRYSINEGNVVTQGGALMVYSALGKLGDSVRIAERFDPAISERELAYMDRKQLGNGEPQDVNGQRVPWLPYFGGTLQVSDYYIVGGITEVNYNISSGGVEAGFNNIGAKARTFTMNVAVDLRIIETRSLLVRKTVSMTKQVSGYEVGANVFRFFGMDLFDLNIGEKGQEPLQLAVRTALEEATIRLVGGATGIDPAPCLTMRSGRIQDYTADEFRAQPQFASANQFWPSQGYPTEKGLGRNGGGAVPTAENPPRAPSPAWAGQPPVNGRNPSAPTATIQIPFEYGDPNIGGPAQAELSRIVAAARQGGADVFLVARETENLDPGQRSRLIDQRINTLINALVNRGVPASAVRVTWRPERTDSTIFKSAPGLQNIARIQIRF